MHKPTQTILILDFGSQYTQLIARRIRELGVYSVLHSCDISEAEIRTIAPAGIILSGGPESVWEENTARAPDIVFELGCPVLGICYGMQTMAAQLGGSVEAAPEREFGYAEVRVKTAGRLFEGIEDRIDADGTALLDMWMSHGDRVSSLPPGFQLIADTTNTPIAAMADEKRHFYGLLFHIEVTHSRQGGRVLARFVQDICGCQTNWDSKHIMHDAIAQIRDQVHDDQVILALSGGVDSSVVAALLQHAIGQQLTCIFVDTGLLRLNELAHVKEIFSKFLGIKILFVDAKQRFLEALKGSSDPEQKRKIIGKLFIDVFTEEAKKTRQY